MKKPLPIYLAFAFAFALNAQQAARPPRDIAHDYLISTAVPAGAYIAKEYKTEHNGVTHIVYKQQFAGLDVLNGEWTINIASDGSVINTGGFLHPQPAPGISVPTTASAMAAVRAAAEAVNPKLAERFFPYAVEPDRSKARSAAEAPLVQRFSANGFGADVEGRPVWFGFNSLTLPAWEFYVVDEDGFTAYNVVVDSVSQRVLEKETLTLFQAPPRGLVFGQSPQPNLKPGVQLTSPPAYVSRTLQSFAGDPAASQRGWVADTETIGNNATVGQNLRGILFAQPLTASSAARDFQFPLELGPSAPIPTNFPGAASTNLFYYMNRAHDLFYLSGFDEAAGNYQKDNFGKGGVAGDALLGYTHYSASGNVFASLNNAFYTTRRGGEDGSPAGIHMFIATSDSGFSDGAYDAEVIIHEYTHGVSLRLVRRLGGFQGGSMGEAWSDFFGLEFTVPEGAPADGVYPQGEYLFQQFGYGIRTRPYSTDMNVNPLTFSQLGRVIRFPEVHADGEIWFEALWEVRANLIRQLGEKEGRRRVRLLVLDGMKLSPPRPSMVDMRDAILLADQVDFKGASQSQIWAGFAKRGLGVLAHASGPDTTHIAASFDTPSPKGSLRFYEDAYVIGESVRVLLADANNPSPTANVQITASSGDLENLILTRSGNIYSGTIGLTSAPSLRSSGAVGATTGDFLTAYYYDTDTGAGPKNIDVTVPVRPAHTVFIGTPAFQFANETALNFRASPFSFRRIDLPFQFPYFGRKYGSLLLFSNGLLAFDLHPGSSCTDRLTLASYNAIAPLWMESRTDGTAQPREDVYVSRATPDSITFRWAGQTDTSTRAPEPLNFAATLFDDGRIMFNYGTGNKNLTVDFPFAGCPISTPTVGISNGNETFVQTVSTHIGAPNLENANTIRFDPPTGNSTLPKGILETPSVGQSFKDVLNGSAIIYDDQAIVTRVDVFIDNSARAAGTRVARNDFCAQQRVNNCPLVGFTFNVDLKGLDIAPGTHSIWLRATNSRGGFTDFPDSPVSFNVEAGQSFPPVGAIEAPAAGAEVSGIVPMRGYVYAQGLRVTAVDVLIDGLTVGRASYGFTARADICTPLPQPAPVNCPNAGFTFNLNTLGSVVPIDNGPHKLQLRVFDETGRTTLIPEAPLDITVKNNGNQPPKGDLTAPLNNDRVSGMMRISGYAYDPDGRIIAVQFYVDGEFRGSIPYGAPRPEVCAALTGITACPNIGFDLNFDSRVLSNGPHVFGVRIFDNAIANVLLPVVRPNSGGININVQN